MFAVSYFADKADDEDCSHLFSANSSIPRVDQDVWYSAFPPKNNLKRHYKVTRVDHGYIDCGQVDGPAYHAEVYLKAIE